MQRLSKLQTENLADIGAFVRTAGREIQRADARLRVWRWPRQAELCLTRTDYVIVRMHLDRAHRILQSLDKHVQILEAEQDMFFEAEVESDFYSPYIDAIADERLSQRMYDL